jgi:hypothetical protein
VASFSLNFLKGNLTTLDSYRNEPLSDMGCKLGSEEYDKLTFKVSVYC